MPLIDEGGKMFVECLGVQVQPRTGGQTHVGTQQDNAWTAVLDRLSDAEPCVASDLQHRKAERKLTQLMLSQTLRLIMPRSGTSNSGLAADTWRDFLADNIAEAVAPAISLFSAGEHSPAAVVGSSHDGE